MTPTLWLKFPDDALFFNRFGDEDRKNLERIFSSSDAGSPWVTAADMLSLRIKPGVEMISWHRNAPYFNWSCFVETISGGAVGTTRAPDGKYAFEISYKIPDLWALLGNQWNITRFLQRPAMPDSDKLVESIALGMALQSLVMRMGADEARLAGWLATPAQAPKKYRKILNQIQSVQMRRTAISPVWKEKFPASAKNFVPAEELPDFFWDDAVPVPAGQSRADTGSGRNWKGLPVCGGKRKGLAIAVTQTMQARHILDLKEKYNASMILVFRRARPETTELFEHAHAVLFAEGGALSHACTVARARNIPSITGLGPEFFEFIRNNEKIWLSIDGAAATIEVI